MLSLPNTPQDGNKHLWELSQTKKTKPKFFLYIPRKPEKNNFFLLLQKKWFEINLKNFLRQNE